MRTFISTLILLAIGINAYAQGVQKLREQAYDLGQAGEWRKALNLYQRVDKMEPGLAQVAYNIGLSYFYLGRNDSALAEMSRAIEIDPDYAYVYENRARVHAAMGNYTGAIADYDYLISVDTANSWFYFQRGVCKRTMDHFAGALEDYNKAIELRPVFIEAYRNRGVIHRLQKNYALALADCNRVLELYTLGVEEWVHDDSNIYGDFSNRAVVKVYLEDYAGACEDLLIAKSLGADVQMLMDLICE